MVVSLHGTIHGKIRNTFVFVLKWICPDDALIFIAKQSPLPRHNKLSYHKRVSLDNTSQILEINI